MNYEYRGYGIELRIGEGFAVKRGGDTLVVCPTYDRAKDAIDEIWNNSKTLADR